MNSLIAALKHSSTGIVQTRKRLPLRLNTRPRLSNNLSDALGARISLYPLPSHAGLFWG
jgi:hypothetical protein